MRLALTLACLLLAANVHAANCATNARGKTVCANDGKAAVYNPNTATVSTAQKSTARVSRTQNSNNVTTTQSSRGGEAKTKNGKGVYSSPNGTTCVKTANNAGCN